MTEFVTRLLAVLAVGLEATLPLVAVVAGASLSLEAARSASNGLRGAIAGAEL